MLSMRKTGSRLHLDWPFRRKTIGVSQWTPAGGIFGGLACPGGSKLVAFSPPFTLFRRILSLLLSGLLLLSLGVYPTWL